MSNEQQSPDPLFQPTCHLRTYCWLEPVEHGGVVEKKRLQQLWVRVAGPIDANINEWRDLPEHKSYD